MSAPMPDCQSLALAFISWNPKAAMQTILFPISSGLKINYWTLNLPKDKLEDLVRIFQTFFKKMKENDTPFHLILNIMKASFYRLHFFGRFCPL